MFEQQMCCNCDEDLWYREIDDYIGVNVKDVGIICKECEKKGIESGEYIIEDNYIKFPTHFTFVVKALPHIRTDHSRIITKDWNRVLEVVGKEKNGFDIAIFEDDISCHGNYIEKAILNDAAQVKDDFIRDSTFLATAYKDESFDVWIYFNERDNNGTHIRWDGIPTFEQYEEDISDIVYSMLNRKGKVFIGCQSRETSSVLPLNGIRSLYYYPTRALKWMGSLEEAEAYWKDLKQLKPEQYQLVVTTEENNKKKRKI